MRPRGLTLRIVAACALLLAVLAAVFSVLLSALGDLRGSTSWTEHSVVVLGTSGELENELGDFASTTRSYVDDPSAEQLRRWRALRDELPASAARLHVLVRDNRVQSRAAVLLRSDIQAFVTDWAEPVISIAGRTGGQQRTLALAQQPMGRNLIAAIRSEFESFNTREKALGLKRGSSSRRHAREAAVIAVSALFALLVAILGSVVIVTRTVILPVRRVGTAAARLGRGELSARVDERGGGEVRDLAQAFNRMAASVRDSRDELESQNRALELQQGELEGALLQLADEKEQVEELRRFIELVSADNDPDRLANTVLTELCDYVGASVGTLFGVDGEHDAALTCLAALGVERAKLPEEILPGEGFAGQAILARQIVTAGFGEDGLRFETFGHQVKLAQEIHVPLVHGEQAIGVVTLGRAVKEQLSPAELERIRYLAAQAAVGLSHAFALRRAGNQAALNRAVLETAYDAFVSFDERGLVTAWNPRAEAIFGWSAMEAIGREIDQLVVPPAERDWYRQRLIEFLRGEESELLNRHVEVTARHRDGHEFPVEVAISPIELDGSWRFNAFVHEISERRLLEERSGRLFSISLDFMCTFTSDGSFRQINPAWSQILGWDEEKLLGTRMLDYVHPDDRERTLEQASKLAEDGQLAANFENRWRCADRSYRWLLWSVHYSHEEDLGYAVAKDVTEAKAGERFFQTRLAVSEALAKADTLEQELAGAVAAAGESLGWEFAAAWLPNDDGSAMRCTAVWGVDGHDVSALRAAFENRELGMGEGTIGRAWETRGPICYRDAGDFSYPFARVLRDAGVRSTVAFPLMAEDGVVAVLSLLSPEAREVDDEMLRVLGAIGEQVGQTVYRRLARMEADRMKDEFLALVSHELRTPLTSIVGYLELLGDDEEELGSEQSRRFLEVIGRNATRLQRLVDDVLFAARAEAGRLALATRDMDLVVVIAESVAAAAPKAEENGVALHLDAHRTPGMDGDPDRLGQALDNLISNALKFTPPGGRVDVIVRNLGERARVDVRDTGLGMTDDDSRRAFDRFFRAPATRDHAPGVGLGLTIVKTIVEGHGGTIDVTSRKGVGTAVVMELPLARAGVGTSRE